MIIEVKSVQQAIVKRHIPEAIMQKLIDEFDHLIEPGTIVTEIILSGAVDDCGDIMQENDNPDFFSVYIRGGDGLLQAIGDFSDREDALAYATRMVEKYGNDSN